jgi:hypothetical protein
LSFVIITHAFEVRVHVMAIDSTVLRAILVYANVVGVLATMGGLEKGWWEVEQANLLAFEASDVLHSARYRVCGAAVKESGPGRLD